MKVKLDKGAYMPERAYATWSATDDYGVIKRHIKVIESYGYEWKLTEREQEDEQRED